MVHEFAFIRYVQPANDGSGPDFRLVADFECGDVSRRMA